jgi:hypothetical protein
VVQGQLRPFIVWSTTMLTRIKVRTHDVDPRRGRYIRDMMFTTNNRLTAEPAPEVRPGQMGVLFDGTGGTPKQVDADRVFDIFLEGIGLLSDAEIAKIKAKLLKFAGSSAATTSAVGITSDARRSVDAVRQGVDAVHAINSTNKAFWDAKNAEDAKLFLGQ